MHCVSFTRCCLPIGEYGHVESFNALCHHFLVLILVDLLSANHITVDLVEDKLLIAHCICQNCRV